MKGDDSGRTVGKGDADGDGGARVREAEAIDEGAWVRDAMLEDMDRVGWSRLVGVEAEVENDVSTSERFAAMGGRRGVVVVGARLT